MDDVTLLATADWDHPIWTNKQHVACALADLGHRVLYVDSIGLRPPRRGGADRGRLLRRLRQGLRPPRRVRGNVWVWSPLVLPGARTAWQVRLNRWILNLGLRLCRLWLRLRPDWLWTYNPLTLQLVDPGPYRRLIYHCVDAIQAQPDMPAATIDAWEERLCRRADIVFVTSPQLLERHRPHNPRTVFHPNVADADHFAAAMTEPLCVPREIERLPRPRLGFIGAISAYKLDLPMLESLARRHPAWTFVLIGPVGEGDPTTEVRDLAALDNVHLLGPRSYADLPACLKGLDVALLPLRLNDYTRAMFPMKFFEYLASGRPVVATAIDALQAFRDVAVITAPHEEAFAEGIARVLRGEGPTLERRLGGARAHTYRGRTESMLEAIHTLPSPP